MIVLMYSALNLFWILCNSVVLNFFQFALVLLARTLIDRPLYRKLMAFVGQKWWVDMTSSCFPDTKLVLSGEFPTDANRPAIIIANHQVDADWWYIWQIARAQNATGNVKMVLKDQLKHVPVLGWGMQLFDFLFLKRDLERDGKHIQKYMDKMIEDQFPFWMVLFPEGTTVHQEYVAKSTAYAKRTNRPVLQRVMLPRTAGLKALLHASTEAKPDIYDMTMAFPSYSGEIPTYEMGYSRHLDKDVPNMKSLLAGKQPGHVHVRSRKYKYDEVVADPEAFLDKRWQEKDELLEYFIQHQKFPDAPEAEHMQELTLSGSLAAVFKMWFCMTMTIFVTPFVTMTFFPAYTLWIVYSCVKSMYDRTINIWWSYSVNLLSANSIREKLSK